MLAPRMGSFATVLVLALATSLPAVAEFRHAYAAAAAASETTAIVIESSLSARATPGGV